MRPGCPYCSTDSNYIFDSRTILRFGSFLRKSDSRRIQRFLCFCCRRTFSKATLDPCYKQKKRQKNHLVYKLLCSAVSMRRTAKICHLNRTTIARKLRFLAQTKRLKFVIENFLEPKAGEVQFDDLETFEVTKCKPLSVTLAVAVPSRRILGFQVSRMQAKGRLIHKAMKKYGTRRDDRAKGRERLFREIRPLMIPNAVIKSDSNPHYRESVERHFPHCNHQQFEGQRGAITGQGELKKIEYDPLFYLNHTCAMLRANIARLVRKTWCTTKVAERLADHIAIYADYHNSVLIQS